MLAPGKGVDVLVDEKDVPSDIDLDPKAKVDDVDRPLIVQAPCGLGRVMLIAFDLEQGAFPQWNDKSQTDFYTKLRGELEPRQSAGGVAKPQPGPGNPAVGWGLDGGPA